MTFDAEGFLRDYWQKKPLLIRNLFPALENPLEPDELAGLACENGIEARIIRQAGERLMTEHGPFAEDRFGTLGPEPWTLLVNAVDHHVPEVSALIAPFRFIPNWRIDDVMVSYAVDRGGVGPHFDQYDVFLVQGLGRRRWQIGGHCDETTALLPNEDLRLLADFAPVEDWVLEPGDVLYVPPGIAHNGVAVGDDCMTYSIGFRAPSRDELIAGWAEHLLDEAAAGEGGDDPRYSDPALLPQANPGEIAADALDRLHAMIAERLLDRRAFARWFGSYNSAPKNPGIDWSPEVAITEAELRAMVGPSSTLMRNPASRFSFVRECADTVVLFVDGQAFDCSEASALLAERIAGAGAISLTCDDVLSPAAAALVVALINSGSIEIT